MKNKEYFIRYVSGGRVGVKGMNNFVRESITNYWRVSGAIMNSFAVKGVRGRMYRYADNHLGYYESGKEALFYEENGTTLNINVLFETEENALRFDSNLRNDSITTKSANSLRNNTIVSTTSTAQLGKRIYYMDYIPTDAELRNDARPVVTVRYFDQSMDEFKYQRIEKLTTFCSIGKAEKCLLASGSHCGEYSQYDKDPNNMLATSRDLKGWFHSLNCKIPLFYLKVDSISDSPIVEDRYKIVLAVVALDQESAGMLDRLIEGTQTNDPLIMNTSVYVTDPTIFQKCLEWKEKDTQKKWADYYSKDSAVL